MIRWWKRRQARKRAREQIDWGLGYIRDRYGPGSPYDRGGSLPPGS